MMVLTIYGSPRSRAIRTLWLAGELGLDYDHVTVGWDDPWLKSPEFLQLNPVGAIPTIDHDGFGLGESLAINLYLAKAFGSTGPIGDQFSVADFNVACVLSPSRTSPLDMSRHQPTTAWLSRCYGRPAAVSARAQFAG